METTPLTTRDLPSRSPLGHCSNDAVSEIREKFFQIWSHKAINISNDLIEYTIGRLQSDRLRFLFQTRNELTHRENVLPFCPMSMHTENDLQRTKEQIRRFCLTTRNLFRHLRSDSRLYPKMGVNLDQNIMIKICRFIFKTKVLMKIFSTRKHLGNQQGDQKSTTDETKAADKKLEQNDPFKNITKAFVVLQSNFEILHGDILDRDFFQNAKTAVQTLPVILDTSKTIRLIFCTLYKLGEPERLAEAEAIRQRRKAFCPRPCRSQKTTPETRKLTMKKQEYKKLNTVKEMLKINQPSATHSSTNTPAGTLSSPSETLQNKKITNQLKPETTPKSKAKQSSKSRSPTSHTKALKNKKSQLAPPSAKMKIKKKKTMKNASPQKSPSTVKTKSTSPNLKSKSQKKSKNKNRNSSKTDLTSSNQYDEKMTDRSRKTSSDQSQVQSNGKHGWTTWLHNATRSLDTILPTHSTDRNAKPLLTTWASRDRISKHISKESFGEFDF